LFCRFDSLCVVDIVIREHNEKTKSGHMSRETNTEKFFTPPKNPQKSDVNWHIKDNEDSKTNLLGCRHLSIMEKLME